MRVNNRQIIYRDPQAGNTGVNVNNILLAAKGGNEGLNLLFFHIA